MASIKVTLTKNGEPASGAKLVYGDSGSGVKVADENGEIIWASVPSGFEASFAYNTFEDDGQGGFTLGSGGSGLYVKAGDDISIEI